MTVGLHIMRPTSIVVAGGGTETASVRADGGVDFANATSLSLNGVFTADYDNYMISIRSIHSASSVGIRARLRVSGSDASGANYVYQFIEANNTTVAAARTSSATETFIGGTSSTANGGDIVYVYGPNLAQPTAFRNVNVWGANSARIYDNASTHSLSTAYDSITVFPSPGFGTFTGMITIYGYAQ